MKKITYILALLFSITLSSQEIDIKDYKGLPIVVLEIGNTKKAFLLDTGAQSSMIFIEYKKRFNFKAYKTYKDTYNGVGGSTSIWHTKGVSLRYDNTELHNEFKGISGKIFKGRLNIVGILGNDFFKKGWVINYKTNKLIKL